VNNQKTLPWRAGQVMLLTAATASSMLIAQTGSAAPGGGRNGTTLSATVSAAGLWERTIESDWTISKTADVNSIEIPPRSSGDITYTITTTKTEKAPVDVYSATGQICVLNGGGVATTGLTIYANIDAKLGAGPYQILQASSVDVSANPVLDPGERGCYPFKTAFTPVAGALYKVNSQVTITNHSGSLGTPKGPSPDAGFSLPTTPVLVYKDESASILDVLTLPTGLSTTSDNSDPWILDGPGEFQYIVTIDNDDKPCETFAAVVNKATLTEADTQQSREATATVNVTTGECPGTGDEPSFSGCTYTQGYWKNHGPGECGNGQNANAWPVSVMTIGSVSYTDSELCSIFNQEVGGNGLISLAHQLIAAKLNTLKASNPASGGGVDTMITQADAMIGGLEVPPVGSGVIATSVSSALNNALTGFNEGSSENGPPHCD